MKLTICGSSAFREQMVQFKSILESMGHEAVVHPHYIASVEGTMPELMERVNREHAALKKENDYIRWYYRAIKESDGILVLNFEKRGVSNYIGGNTLMEIGFAHVNNKRIYLLNPVPDVGYKDEIEAMYTHMLDGDIKNLAE